MVATLWSNALGLREVGIEDDFFELGGNSLVAVQLGSKLRQRYDLELPMAALFDKPTVRDLAAFIEQELMAKVEAMSDAEAAALLDMIGAA